MSDKKKQQFTQKRLRELEKQVQEYTDEDLLNEADELEKEMQAGNITYDLPDDFFQQILAKGKLIEAERDRNEQKPVDQGVEKEAETKIKRVWDETVPPNAELINIPVMTILPPSEQLMKPGDAAGKPEEETDLSHATKVMTAVESEPEQAMVRADIADADEMKVEAPKAEAAVHENKVVVRNNSGRDNGQGRKKPKRKVKLRWKVLLTVMILVMVPLAAGITSGGKKHFTIDFKQREGVNKQDIVLNNNADTENGIDEEAKTYTQIEQDVGIDALCIGDRPFELTYDRSEVMGKNVYMYFDYGDSGYLMLKQALYPNSSVVNVVSDGNLIGEVYNEKLEMNINIYEESIQDGNTKYNAVLSLDNAYYLITAVMNLEDYVRILKDLYF